MTEEETVEDAEETFAQAEAEDLEDLAEDEEGVKLEQLTPEGFIRKAQDPGLRQLIDRDLDLIREKTGATWKQMLRGYMLVLRSIAVSMPWDEEDGLDAKRLHTDAKMTLPSWRECIGVLLGLDFANDKAELTPPPTEEEEDAPDDESGEE